MTAINNYEYLNVFGYERRNVAEDVVLQAVTEGVHCLDRGDSEGGEMNGNPMEGSKDKEEVKVDDDDPFAAEPDEGGGGEKEKAVDASKDKESDEQLVSKGSKESSPGLGASKDHQIETVEMSQRTPPGTAPLEDDTEEGDLSRIERREVKSPVPKLDFSMLHTEVEVYTS